LVKLVASIESTVVKEDRQNLCIVLGIDEFDTFFDNTKTKQRMKDLFSDIFIDDVNFEMLRSHYRGKLCRIWDFLADKAVKRQCDFLLLVGDGVVFRTTDWKTDIESQFTKVSLSRDLPFGIGVIAFRDEAFEVFPTFPVIHRIHFEIFGCLFPVEFINQHGDPFLFEIYRRFGASEFAFTATLNNTIGGNLDGRYVKHNFDWKSDILTAAVAKVSCYLEKKQTVELFTCMNIVVPTYRCNVDILSKMTALSSGNKNASISILVVIDNPLLAQSMKSDLKKLEDYTSNHLVRVVINTENLGASLSRNVGIASSSGDWVVLLDDDVIPDDDILDAYIGAILRNPKSRVLIGLTELPKPITYMEQALMASQMTFFYDVSRRMRNPPWGVTANMCIRNRTSDQIWFSADYPKTGGGEDVDFCLRIKDLYPYHLRNHMVVSVPEARVVHPFWQDILKQVRGWACGDVRCLSKLARNTFYTLPNWIEFIFITAVYIVATSCTMASCVWFVKVSCLVLLVEIFLISSIAYPNTANSTHTGRIIVSILAAAPVLSKDLVRIIIKLSQGHLAHICLQFDWMDGQRDHVDVTKIGQAIKTVVYVFLAMALSFSVKDNSFCYFLIAIILVIGLFWTQTQDSQKMEVAELISRLEPLPMEFPDDGLCPFVILTFQRTGSNFLCGKLHNHHEIIMHNEIWNDAKIWTYQTEDILADPSWNWDIIRRNENPMEFFDDIFHRKSMKKENCKAVGFKLFPDHFNDSNDDIMKRLLADKRIKKIILRRDNYLDVYASKLRSDKTGSYVSKALDNIPIWIDSSSFECFIDYYDKCYDYYELLVQG
jgi:glycosyltransferase involved in cell wall biosynthesis